MVKRFKSFSCDHDFKYDDIKFLSLMYCYFIYLCFCSLIKNNSNAKLIEDKEKKITISMFGEINW